MPQYDSVTFAEARPPAPWYANPYIILTALISLLAVGFASVLLLLLFVLPWSSEIVRYMQGKMVDVKTGRVEIDASFTPVVSTAQAAPVPVTGAPQAYVWHALGNFDRSVPGATKLEGDFTLHVGGANSYDFVGKHVHSGAADYFRFDALPDRIGAVRFGQYRGQWLRLWTDTIREYVKLPLFGADHGPVSDADRAALTEHVRRTALFQVDERLDDEVIEGNRTFRYRIKTDPDNILLRDLYDRVEAARLGRALTDKERADSQAFFASLKLKDIQVWISSPDHYLRRLSVVADYDGAKRKGEFKALVNFSDLDRPLNAAFGTAPIDSRDVTPALASLLAGLRGHLPLAKDGPPPNVTTDSGTGLPIETDFSDDADADGDGLSNGLELFYGTDPQVQDTDADGVTDNDEVLAGCNPTGDGWIFDFGATDDECGL